MDKKIFLSLITKHKTHNQAKLYFKDSIPMPGKNGFNFRYIKTEITNKDSYAQQEIRRKGKDRVCKNPP